jgi:hypothetical protein
MPKQTASRSPLALSPEGHAAPPPRNWKDHPLVAATLGVTGTIALAVVLVKEVILPTHTASLTNQIATLTAEKTALLRGSAETDQIIRSQKQTLEGSEQKIAALEQQLHEARVNNLFESGNPYPIGLGGVRIGQKISEVSRVYAGKKIEEDDGYFALDVNHPVFSHLTYYFNPRDKIITHILFHGQYYSKLGDTFLQQKFVHAFGSPRTWAKPEYYSWTFANAITIYKSNPKNYVLMGGNFTPNRWPSS